MSLLRALPALTLALWPQETPAPAGASGAPPQEDAAPEAQEPAAEPDPSVGSHEGLARLATELEDALASRYPSLAEGFGEDSTREPRAEDYAWWTRFLEHHTNSLENLWSASLDERERSLRDALVDRCQTETILVTSLPRRRWDPMFHLELVTDELARARGETGAERKRRLDLCAEILDRARAQIVSLRNGWIEEAQQRAAGLRQELQAFAAEPGGEMVLAACQRFDEWLRNSDVRRGETMPRVGRHNFAALVDACSGSELELDELHTKLLREVARLDNEIGLGPDPEPTGLSVEQIFEQAAACVSFAREHLSGGELLPPAATELELVQRPGAPYPDGAAFVRHEADRTRIVVTLPNPNWPVPLAQSQARELNPLTLGAWSLRWAVPGEGQLIEIAREKGAAKPLSWSRAMLEGWGLYALDWLMRHPSTAPAFRREQPALCREMLRVRRYETALMLASLEWHALERPEGMIAEDLARRTGIELTRAQIEVRRVTHDPLLGVGALGAIEIVALEQRLSVRMPGVDPIRQVLSLLSEHPGLRPQDLLRHDLVGRREND